MNTSCSLCAAPMTCGANDKSCWCQSLPSLPASQVDSKRSCLCNTCLKAELKKGLLMFGIANCDTVKKARASLTQRGIDYTFWDYKKFGVPTDWLDEWIVALGWEALVNKRGTTWRKLDSVVQANLVDAETAKALMLANPSVIKRPVMSDGGLVKIGV